MQKQKTVSLTLETYNRLKERAHPGQTLGGVIRELLDIVPLDHPYVPPKNRDNTPLLQGQK